MWYKQMAWNTKTDLQSLNNFYGSKMKKFLIAIIILITNLNLAQNPNLGTSGAQFLEIPIGAREAAMGGAIVGLTNDASSLFWNPAGITRIQGNAAHFSYMNWFDMFDFNAAAVAFNLEGIGSIGVSFILLTMDEVEITTENEPNGTGRFYDAQDFAIAITYSRLISEQFGVGLSIKYVEQSIWNESATGLAFDIGTQYKLDFQNLTIAMAMTNFGGDLKYEGEDLNIIHDRNDNVPLNRLTPAQLVTDEFPLPLTFQVGIGFDVYTSNFVKVRGAIDAIHPNDQNERMHFGTEFSFFDRIFLRGGYKHNYDDEDFTFGAGANLPLDNTLISFDYAYSLYDILPSIHRISMGLKF